MGFLNGVLYVSYSMLFPMDRQSGDLEHRFRYIQTECSLIRIARLKIPCVINANLKGIYWYGSTVHVFSDIYIPSVCSSVYTESVRLHVPAVLQAVNVDHDPKTSIFMFSRAVPLK